MCANFTTVLSFLLFTFICFLLADLWSVFTLCFTWRQGNPWIPIVERWKIHVKRHCCFALVEILYSESKNKKYKSIHISSRDMRTLREHTSPPRATVALCLVQFLLVGRGNNKSLMHPVKRNNARTLQNVSRAEIVFTRMRYIYLERKLGSSCRPKY